MYPATSAYDIGGNVGDPISALLQQVALAVLYRPLQQNDTFTGALSLTEVSNFDGL